MIARNLSKLAILGMDFFYAHRAMINLNNNRVLIPESNDNSLSISGGIDTNYNNRSCLDRNHYYSGKNNKASAMHNKRLHSGWRASNI